MKENGGGHCGDGGVRADAVVMWWWQERWGVKTMLYHVSKTGISVRVLSREQKE